MIRVLIFLLFSFVANANTLVVDRIEFNCVKNNNCKFLKNEFNSLKREYSSIYHLQKLLKVYILSEGIKNFRYELWEYDKAKYNLKVFLTPKPKVFELVKKIIVSTKKTDPVIKVLNGLSSFFSNSDYDIELPTLLPLKEGEYFDENKLNRTVEMLKSTFVSKGFVDAQITTEQKKTNSGLKITLNCKLGRPLRVKHISVVSDNEYLKKIMVRKLSFLNKKVFDLQKIKDLVDYTGIKFSDSGYYLNDVSFRYTRLSKYEVELFVNIKSNGLHVFNVKGTSKLPISQIKDSLVTYLKTIRKEIDNESIKELLFSKYQDNGLLNSKFIITKKRYKDSRGNNTIRYEITIEENNYFKLNKLKFIGNNIYTDKFLKDLFFENSFYLNSYGIVDLKYYLSFKEKLRQSYIADGFVNVVVEDPIQEIDYKDGVVNLSFKIREGVRAKVNKIQFKGISSDLSDQLELKLSNKILSYFNPLELDKDLKIITDFLSSQGYYFSKITNSKLLTLVTYNRDNSFVDLTFDIDLGPKISLNKIIIIGNRKTRSIIIRRALTFKEGDLLTRDSLRSSQTNLLALGLFSSINLTPVESRSEKVDLLVKLKEKEFGLVELAPGLRTDLGIKLSGSLSYINIDGLNKQLSIKGQVNQRLDFRTLDERRREAGKQLLEHQFSVAFNENNIFDSGLDFNTTISNQRRRFFAFDADIRRINATVTRDWTNWLGTSLKFQVESISQFDATEQRDSGEFQIGSLTPSVSLDFRNSRINPTKGAFFNLSGEFASPTFYSQDNDDLVINYYKLVTRSRFYIPFPNGTFAVSFAAGAQKNLATDMRIDDQGFLVSEGFIPNIKVFRLSGIDIVRGFEDDEINRLPSGVDISEVVVDDTAYMANLKFEPRFFINDSMMLGVFYDAGSVFVDSYDLSKLRSSVGVTFKYLTPVGTLDFDYGIKLLRKRSSDGIMDSPGRLHVSIGFF